MLSLLTITLYLAALAILLHQVFRKESLKIAGRTYAVLWLVAAGLVCHAVSVFLSIHTEDGYVFSFFKMPSLFFVVINLVVLLSSLRKPLHNLFIFLLPLSVAAIVLDLLLSEAQSSAERYSSGVITHIIFSILAYSLLTIASLQAVFLAYQNHQLKHKHLRGVMGILPPLQTMEALLFELVWAGQILLTASLVTGAVYMESFFGQHLAHKTTFSIISWLIYAVLLWGRHTLGWRGASAIRWTLGGFAALMLAYFGSKLVLEVILHR